MYITEPASHGENKKGRRQNGALSCCEKIGYACTPSTLSLCPQERRARIVVLEPAVECQYCAVLARMPLSYGRLMVG